MVIPITPSVERRYVGRLPYCSANGCQSSAILLPQPFRRTNATKGTAFVSRLDLAHQVIDRKRRDLVRVEFVACLARIGNYSLSSTLRQTSTDQVDEICLLFNRKQLDGIEHVIKCGRLLHLLLKWQSTRLREERWLITSAGPDDDVYSCIEIRGDLLNVPVSFCPQPFE